MKVDKPTNFLALFDTHFGWERQKIHGKDVLKATHAAPAIRAVLKFAKDWKPKALILGGDQLNCGPISHWLKGKPRLTAGFNLRREMDELDGLLLKPLDAILPPDAIRIWHEGNHEAWIQDHIDANPGTEGLLEPRNYLHLAERGYKIFEIGEVSNLGKLYFVHGDVVLKLGSTVNPAKTLVNAYRRNIRAGHLHTYGAAVEVTPIDVKDFHTAIVVPSLSSRNPAFVKNNPSCAINGFLYGTVFPDGSFSDEVVIINKGKFSVGGKVYDGNK